MNVKSNNHGYTLLEVLISLFLTGLIATAGFKFYSGFHNHTLAQQSIGDMQHESRNVLQEMVKSVRNAGFKVGSHAPYSINGDSLYVFTGESGTIDTLLFFLDVYTCDCDLAGLTTIPHRLWPRKMMIQHNSEAPALYADAIAGVTYTTPETDILLVTLETQTVQADEQYAFNDGVRTCRFTERVMLRNVAD